MPDSTTRPPAAHDPYAALRVPDFRALLTGRFAVTFGEQMVDVGLGWEIYARTHSALALGLVGLALIIPVALLSLPAGALVDRSDRRHVLVWAQSAIALAALGIAVLSWRQGPIPLIYVCIFAIGMGDAFTSPAATALVAQVVPDEVFPNAATWNSSTFQLAAVIGPAVGGGIIALQGHATLIFVIYVLASAANIGMVFTIRNIRPLPAEQRASNRARHTTDLRTLFAGARFLGQTPVLLAAITLDLFAVLFGGATTLLPVFALSVLHVGAVGLGFLRAAPSVGAIVMALVLAHRRPSSHAGRTLLLAVAGFGVATIVFGASHSFPLSLAALVALGALDNISVVIRSTLVLTRTPPSMLGRISAINSIFIGASNQLGGFESGVTAAAFGPVISVAGGGACTVIVVVLVALIWPQLRKLGPLDPAMVNAAEVAAPIKDEERLSITKIPSSEWASEGADEGTPSDRARNGHQDIRHQTRWDVASDADLPRT